MADKSNTSSTTKKTKQLEAIWPFGVLDAWARMAQDNLEHVKNAGETCEKMEKEISGLMKEAIDYQFALGRQFRQMSVEAVETSLDWATSA